MALVLSSLSWIDKRILEICTRVVPAEFLLDARESVYTTIRNDIVGHTGIEHAVFSDLYMRVVKSGKFDCG